MAKKKSVKKAQSETPSLKPGEPSIQEYIDDIAPLWRYQTRYIERMMWKMNDDKQRKAVSIAILAAEDAFLALGLTTVTFAFPADTDEKLRADAEAGFLKLQQGSNDLAKGLFHDK